MAFRTVSGTNSGTKSSMKMKCSTLLQKLPNNQLKGTDKMNYITVKEIAEKWNVSMRLVYRYCTQGRIPDAYQEFGIWYIPENAAKPTR